MGFEFNQDDVKYIESGSKLALLVAGIFLIPFGYIMLLIRESSDHHSKAYIYGTFGGILSIPLGILLIILGILYTEMIYEFHPDKLIQIKKKSGEIQHEIPMKQINKIHKTITYRQKKPNAQMDLSEIEYDFYYPNGSINIGASRDTVSSQQFDMFIQSRLNKQLFYQERVIRPRK